MFRHFYTHHKIPNSVVCAAGAALLLAWLSTTDSPSTSNHDAQKRLVVPLVADGAQPDSSGKKAKSPLDLSVLFFRG